MLFSRYIALGDSMTEGMTDEVVNCQPASLVHHSGAVGASGSPLQRDSTGAHPITGRVRGSGSGTSRPRSSE